MEIEKIVGIVLGSSVFAALVTASFTRKSHEETVALKYITEERAKWREKIKETMITLNEAVNSPQINGERLTKTRKASTYLKLSLNPDPKHKLDSEILECIKKLCDAPNYERFSTLEEKVSILLKHDWERAKREAHAPISSLLLSVFVIGLVWCIFNFIINKTSIYLIIQKVPYVSGAYSEIALSFALIAVAISLLVWCTKKIYELFLNQKVIKLNKALQRTSR
ncbi:hypothetical protein RO575_08580 [Methylomonas sp. MO1]|uniref:hypothetical protein n=1 Tax=Methylomonas sp. MO1 TaxID=3073619 RepID=UPI0028A4D8A5|nr:hypothetical protein [Methylomonas sp. MO1]MDT4289612.1 hypothetical protein [Methylomonas sp. MO1]